MILTKKLFLAYDTRDSNDGLGAQFQRILSVYCIAKHFGTSYIHFPIVDFDEQVFRKLEPKEKLSVLAEWNALASAEVISNLEPKTKLNFSVGNLTPANLKFIILLCRIFQISLTLRLRNPRLITDKVPECFANANDFLHPKLRSHSDNGKPKNKPIKIVVHIRQGELRLSQFMHRYLPFNYFEKILSIIVPELQNRNLNFTLTVPVEPNMTNTISDKTAEVIHSLKVDKSNEYVNVSSEGNVTLVFEQLDSLTNPYLYTATWQDSGSSYTDFLQMLTADILIISKSSFSFTAGLLNQGGVVIYTPFWHTALSGWPIGDRLTSDEFSSALDAWIASIDYE